MDPKVVHNVRRYSNRRMYDDVTSSFITLDDIATFVVSGEEVVVTEPSTRSNVTNHTLAMALAKRLESDRSKLGHALLIDVIQDLA